MDGLLRALETFFDRFSAIEWWAVGLAALCHFAKMGARTRAWRNVLAAANPQAEVRWRSVFGAYAAGVGVNAVIPARGGDVLKLYLVKRRIEGSAYPTLAATLLVETLLDTTLAASLLVWALVAGVLPGLDVMPSLPEIDWLWAFHHPRLALAVGLGLLALGLLVIGWAARHVVAFWERVAAGFAVMRPPSRYLRAVVPWQLVDWAFRLGTIYFLLLAFGIPASAHNALLVQVTQSLSTILPLTPAGIGTEQALLAYVFRGVAPGVDVLAFSVGMKLVIVALNLTAGTIAILVMARTLRWRSIVER